MEETIKTANVAQRRRERKEQKYGLSANIVDRQQVKIGKCAAKNLKSFALKGKEVFFKASNFDILLQVSTTRYEIVVSSS